MAELVGSNHLTVRNTNLTTTDWNADNLLIGDRGVIDDGTIGSIQENKQLDDLVAQLRCAVRFSDTKQINPKTLEWWESWRTLSNLKLTDTISDKSCTILSKFI